MSFLRRWFDQARYIKDLERDLENKDRDLEFAQKVNEWQKARAKAAEEALEKERKGHILDLRKTADLIARAQKLPERFIKNTEDEQKEVEKEDLSVTQIADIEWAARHMRDGDLQAELEDVPPLDHYISLIKENPEKYINL